MRSNSDPPHVRVKEGLWHALECPRVCTLSHMWECGELLNFVSIHQFRRRVERINNNNKNDRRAFKNPCQSTAKIGLVKFQVVWTKKTQNTKAVVTKEE